MTKKTTRNGGKSGAGKGSTPRTKSAGQRSGKPAKTGKSLPPWMPDLPPTGGGAKSSAPATRRAAPARTSGRFVDAHAQREAQRYDQPIASREAILGFLEAAEGPQTAEEIAGPLGLQAPDRFEALSKRLGAMVRDGQLVQNRRGGFAPVQHTALIAGIPPMLLLTAMAIGVVTDFGKIEAAICGVAPIIRATVVPVTIATTLPIKQMVMIDFQRARIWCSCSYKGKANATTAGCSRSLRILLPRK